MKEPERQWTNDVSRIAVGDVLRWTEPIWPQSKGRRNRYGKRRAPPNGEQRVTALVLERDERGDLHLEVIDAVVASNRYDVPLKSARSLTVSRFFES
jgi:hypothetical protein